MQKRIEAIGRFFKTIGHQRLDGLGWAKAFGGKLLKLIVSTARGFSVDGCVLRASALTLYSLLSIVPVMAMAFGIAKGFGFEKLLTTELLEKFSSQEMVVTQIIYYANTLLKNTHGGMLAVIGLGLLFCALVIVLGHIERCLNAIWKIEASRTAWRKIGDYLAIFLVGPLLVVISSSAMVYIITELNQYGEKLPIGRLISPVTVIAVKLIPLLSIWLLLALVYIGLPNTRVRPLSGAIAALAAGLAFVGLQWLYIIFQIGVAHYNAIYGSFAALPLFMIWLNLSWLIVLAGAELAYAHQHIGHGDLAGKSGAISPAMRKLIALRLTQHVIAGFKAGAKPSTAEQIGQDVGLAFFLAREILSELAQSRVLIESRPGQGHEPVFLPARDPESLTALFVLTALDRRGINRLPVARSREIEALAEAMTTLENAMEHSPGNLRLKDI
jgi:membrane protein